MKSPLFVSVSRLALGLCIALVGACTSDGAACERTSTWTRYTAPECRTCVGNACGSTVIAYATRFGEPQCRAEYECAQRNACDPGLYRTPFQCGCLDACYTTPYCREAVTHVFECMAANCTEQCR